MWKVGFSCFHCGKRKQEPMPWVGGGQCRLGTFEGPSPEMLPSSMVIVTQLEARPEGPWCLPLSP